MSEKKIFDRVKHLDLYLLLGIEPDANEKQIRKAYRKKAVKVHPDKNPDNPKATEQFQQLSDALDVLGALESRQSYDNLLKARKANELRNRQLDAKRRKLIEDLEQRETRAKEEENKEISNKKREKNLIETLRKEGQKLLEEEQERVRQEIEERTKKSKEKGTTKQNGGSKLLKVRWKGLKSDYNSDVLKRIFSKYGNVSNVVLSDEKNENNDNVKKRSALVEMDTCRGALNASKIEPGLPDIPLKVKLLEDPHNVDNHVINDAISDNYSKEEIKKFDDFESMVFEQMRQAELRKTKSQENS